MAEFFHGAKSRQVPTRLVPSASVSAAICMAFGCAPIHRLSPEAQNKAMPGSIILAYTNAEAGEQLGIDSAADNVKWDLSIVAFTQFNLYNFGPVLFVNLFNPKTHFKPISGEELKFTGSVGYFTAKLKNGDVITFTSINNFTEGTDFTVNKITGVISVIADSALEAKIQETDHAPILADYTCAAPEMVTANDCIGGYDVATGISTGLELVEQAFPRFSLIPGSLVSARFGEDVTVAAIMAAKTQNINGVFNCVAFADISTDAVKLYSEAPAYKNAKSLISENLLLCWPKALFGEREIPLSVHVAGLVAQVDDANGGTPFASPSNKAVQMQAAMAGEKETTLTLPQANYLNANGITTAFNFNGWRLWGNRTAAYPGNTDPKDSFLANRRMLAWYGNRLVLTYFQNVDSPINNRLIQTIVNSEQMFLNSLVASGALTGGRIEFLQDDNSILDVMDGMIKFRVFLGFASPAEHIEFILEYDPAYLEALFA